MVRACSKTKDSSIFAITLSAFRLKFQGLHCRRSQDLIFDQALRLFVILFFCWMPWSIQAEVKVSASADESSLVANQPITGTITIEHDQQLQVDPASFQMEDKPLETTLIKDERISPDSAIIVSIYKFNMPGKPIGLYALPSISVKVGNQVYSSIATSYQISESRVFAPSEGEPFLKLEQEIESQNLLYPGQRARFIYRYFYRGNIALSKEVLPLLDAQGFKKIGDKEIKDLSNGTISVQEISQWAEAIKPGTYTYGPSLVEGVSYQQDYLKRRIYSHSKLTSELPAISVTVSPFPSQNKPPSFNGAVGQFDLKTTLLGPSKVVLGDPLTLLIEISGNPSALENVILPEIKQQPGFAGMFRMSDLPSPGLIKDSMKQFNLDLWPLSTTVNEIPPIEFSYFDPQEGKYHILSSHPIAITVIKPSSSPSSTHVKEAPLPEVVPKREERPESHQPTLLPIEIESVYPLQSNDLRNMFLGSWWVMLLIPLSLGVLIFQVYLKKYLDFIKSQVKPLNSEQLFKKALSRSPDSPECFYMIEQAFTLLLVEKGEIPSPTHPDELPTKGMSQQVRGFLTKLERLHFVGKGMDSKILKEAKELFFQLKNESTERRKV